MDAEVRKIGYRKIEEREVCSREGGTSLFS